MINLGAKRLDYPARPPQLNLAHPAASGMRLACVAGPGGAMRDLWTGAIKGAVGGAGFANYEVNTLGPTVWPNGLSSSSVIQFPAFSTGESLNEHTLAIIFQPRSFGAGLGTVVSPASNLSLDTLAPNNISYANGVTLWSLLCTPGHDYFVAASASFFHTPTTNSVVVDLTTGQTTLLPANASSVITSAANYDVLAASGSSVAAGTGRVAAAMLSTARLSPAQLLAWAADPWSFWYKPRTTSTVFLATRPQIIPANSLALSTNDAKDIAAFATTVSSTVPRLSYFVNGTVINRMKVALGDNTVTPSAGNSVDGQGSAGQLVIGTTALTPNSSTGVLATLPLNYPSFTYAGRAATMLGVPLSAVPSATGTASLAELRDSVGNTIVAGLTVGAVGSGANIQISNTAVDPTQLLICNSGTITS